MPRTLANSLPAPHTLSLRPPIPADYRELSTWIPDAAACRRWAGSRLAFPFHPGELEVLLQASERHCFALSDATNRFVGYAQSWTDRPPDCHLGRLIVAPEARGRGYGRRLCELLIAHHGQGSQPLTLRVLRDNTVAHALYLSLGFQACATNSTPEILFMRRPATALR